MTMIERVARALCQHGQEGCWETHFADALRAIEAMREPTEEMLDYAWPMLTEAKTGFFKEPGRHFWRAMLAVAADPKEN
jgi:hypothetical protein